MFSNYKNLLEQRIIKNVESILEDLDQIFSKYNINYCVIGGVALYRYNYIRMTTDIDILVDKKDMTKLSNIPIGFLKQLSRTLRKFKHQDSGTEIDILFSGDHAGNKQGIEYLKPQVISKDHIIDLEYLVAYKVSSGLYGQRYKDYGDVQELIKRNNLPQDYLKGFPIDIETEYKQIWNKS